MERLTRLFQRHGYISGLVIDEADGMPSSGAYAHRFGSLIRAYSLVGFTPDRDYHYIEVNRLLRLFHGDEVERVIREITRLGGTVTRNPATVAPETEIDEVATIMTNKGYHTIPVVDGGKLVGIIGLRDVLATLLDKQ